MTSDDNSLCLFTVASILCDVESRPKWDNLFTKVEVLERFENHKIVYW